MIGLVRGQQEFKGDFGKDRPSDPEASQSQFERGHYVTSLVLSLNKPTQTHTTWAHWAQTAMGLVTPHARLWMLLIWRGALTCVF